MSIEPQRPERQREAGRLLAAADTTASSKTAAAEIADDAVGVGNGGEHAFAGQPRLFLARQNADRRAQRIARPRHELVAVLRVAHGGGRHRFDARTPTAAAISRKRASAVIAASLPFIVEQAGRHHVAADARTATFSLKSDTGTARQPVVDDETNGVRADIDDARTALGAHGSGRRGRRVVSAVGCVI